MTDEGMEEGGPGTLWAAAGQYLGYGLTWALSTLLFMMGGWWIDGKLGTTPLLTILGAFVGAGAGFYSLYHHITVAAGEPNQEDGA